MAEFKTLYKNEDGIRRTLITDSDDPNRMHVKTDLDIDGILDGIARDRDLIDPKSVNKLVARVPMTIYERSIHEQWDEGDWKKFLNDPDNAALRVWQGRV